MPTPWTYQTFKNIIEDFREIYLKMLYFLVNYMDKEKIKK